MFYITVKDRYMRKLGIISNDIPQALHFRDDKQHEFLAEGAETFELTIEKYMNGLLQENTGMLVYGNMLSFYDENNNPHVFMIQHPIETRRTIQLQCTSLNLEMINEQVAKYSSTTPLTFFKYLNNMGMLINSSMQLNINEVSDKTLALTFDTQETKLARLLNLVSSFGAECEMLPILTTEGLMDHLELNVYLANDGGTHAGVGRYRNDVLLTIGKDVQDITRDIDGTNLFNATVVTGQNGELIRNSNVSILNDNGEEEFYIRPGSSTAYAPLSKMKYPATADLNNTDGWTRRDFQIQATAPSELADYAIKMLKSYAYPVITYSLTTTTGLNWNRYNLHIGDTIKISDMKFDDQGLVLSARVTEKVTSRANPNLNSVVFSNFVRRKVQTSDELKNLITQQLPFNISILTDNGTVLKKAGDSTNLSVYMSRGQSLDIQVTPDSYVWTMNGTQISTGDTLPVSYESLTQDTNLITVQTSINGSVVGTSQITISKLTDGEIGRSIVGAPKYKYMTTTTQVAPTDAWDSTNWTYNIPTMSSVNKYLWQITQILYNAEPTSSYSTALLSVYGDQGNAGYFMSLSPDTIVVATDGGGQNGDYSNANATASVYHGTSDNTSKWTISVDVSTGVTGTLTDATYHITGLTENSSYVDFVATNNDDDTLTITKRLIITKAKSGLPGKGVDHTIISYAVSSSSTVMPSGDPSIPSDDWKSEIPAALPGQYIWTATTYVYTDETKSNPQYTIGTPGATGSKVVSTVTQYSNSTDLNIPLDWYATIALLEAERPTKAGMYLWTRTTITYDDPSIEPVIQYLNAYYGQNGQPGDPGQDPIVINLTKPLLIIQANAEGVIDNTTGYNNTDSIFSLAQAGNNLLPVQVPSDGNYANGSYSLSYTTQDINLTTVDIDSVSMSIKIGKLQQMSSDTSSASVNYLATGKDYYGNSFTKNIVQTITKTLNSYGGRIFIMYAPTNDLTLEDMSVNPQYNSLYIGTAVGSSLYSPTKKAQYIWTEYATDNIVYSPTVPLNPLNGERWINNNPNSPNYNQQMVYNGTTQTWVLDMFSANNIFSNRIYAEGGDFKWIKSDNYSESNHIGTFINLETGEIELGSSAVDKDGNPIQTSDTSLNRYLSWKDLGDGNKALVIGDVTSGSSLQLTPDRMSFYNGDTEVMYITNQILRINQAILLQGLYIGQHKMESRGKHTVFVFTGGV